MPEVQAIRVRVAGVKNPRVRDDLGRDVTLLRQKPFTTRLMQLRTPTIATTAMSQTDYFDVDYYGFVNIDD
jgi:hypothetical protein